METIDTEEELNIAKELSAIETDRVRWYNRRLIAFISLYTVIGILLGIIIGSSINPLMIGIINPISDLIIWILLGLLSLTGAYMGLSTWADIKKS